MEYLIVRNWSKFQHYKHRNPPWIKLHTCLLEDPDFEALPDASKLLAVCIWLMASRTGADKIPNDPAWLRKHLPIKGTIDVTPLIDAGYLTVLAPCLQDASTMLASCLQDACSEKSREEQSREETTSSTSSTEEGQVFAHYLARSGRDPDRYKLTPKRRAKIKTRLQEFDVSALCAAIDSCFASPFHQGENERGQTYNDLAEHILRSHEKVDWWLDQAGRSGRNGKNQRA